MQFEFSRQSYQNTISNALFISYRQTFISMKLSVEFQRAKKLSMQLIEIQCKLWEHFNWYNVKRQAKLLRPCLSNLPLHEKKNIFQQFLKRPPKQISNFCSKSQSTYENINIIQYIPYTCIKFINTKMVGT